jgi:hypothetical protein
MTHFVLTPEQATFVQSSKGKIPVELPDGTVVGYLSPKRADLEGAWKPTAEEVAAAEKAAEASGRWHTTKEVLDHLQSLDHA